MKLSTNGKGIEGRFTRFPVSTIRYDTIAEFNVDSKAECDQLNLAHETKTNKITVSFFSLFDISFIIRDAITTTSLYRCGPVTALQTVS